MVSFNKLAVVGALAAFASAAAIESAATTTDLSNAGVVDDVQDAVAAPEDDAASGELEDRGFGAIFGIVSALKQAAVFKTSMITTSTLDSMNSCLTGVQGGLSSYGSGSVLNKLTQEAQVIGGLTLLCGNLNACANNIVAYVNGRNYNPECAPKIRELYSNVQAVQGCLQGSASLSSYKSSIQSAHSKLASCLPNL